MRSNAGLEETEEPERLPAEKDFPVPPVEETLGETLVKQSTVPAPAIDELVLTGIVNMRTYVKIYVDDKLPKEYIFQPGSRPQWSAREGLDVVVGNAAGIEFDFNGKIVRDLGGLGKVVRVSFPENFKSSIYEE